MRENAEEERDVGLDAADTELDERAEHLPARNLERRAVDGALDEERVVVGRDLRAGESRARVEADAVAAGTLVDLDLARVGLEALRGVLGRDAALDGVTALADRVLREAELGQRRSGGDLDLGGDDVDAGDGLRDRVLDLDAGWKRGVSCLGNSRWRGTSSRLISMK